eukprot:CAMPEP_0194341928 /NCGR_PEP_ID=MMETSP0171-20130528/91245_1 /TAXON_ID=218684 /ORGANISM="Corethron pennatum, Strain L29A3" /LENGTH=61 /DNA_ID=CAMNT_0039107447 /DNA_START=54 /DNA_END=235 /DNA_ORIENTATION=+
MVRQKLKPLDNQFDLTTAVFSGDNTSNSEVPENVAKEKQPPLERARSPCYESMMHQPAPKV